MKYEDFAVDMETNDIFFDSRGDIACNPTNTTDEYRRSQIIKDMYFKIKVEEFVILSFDTRSEKSMFVKDLLMQDNRIESLLVIINDTKDAGIADITIKDLKIKDGAFYG